MHTAAQPEPPRTDRLAEEEATAIPAPIPTLRRAPRRVRQRRSRWLVHGTQLLLLVAVIAFWQIGSTTGLLDEFLWSTPADAWDRVVQWLGDGTIADNLFTTLYEAVVAFVLGVVGGVLAGFALAMSDFWSRVLNPYVVLLNAIPRLVFAPLFFLLFGLGPNSKIALGFTLVFFIVFFNAFRGVREVDRVILDNARMLGAVSRWQRIRYVLLPSALTWILSSLHAAVGFAMIGAIVGEYLGSSEGLGHVIAQAQGNLDATGVMAGLIVLSVVAAVVELGVTQLERRLIKWKPAQH
jgi:NitT/TauT family transport system permease protein